MRLLANLGWLLFAPLSPFVAAFITGIWLILVVRLGLLPRILICSEMPISQQKRVTKSVTRVVLSAGLVGVPATVFLCWITQLYARVGDLVTTTIVEESLGIVASFLFSPVWLVLIILAWLALLLHFGLHRLLNRLRVPVQRRKHITWYAVMTMLIIGVVTGIGGFIWWLYTPSTHWNGLDRLLSFEIVVLSPATSLLTIGMVVMFPVSLMEALSADQDEVQYEPLARRVTIALLFIFILLSIVGGLWSVHIYRLWTHGRL